MTAGSRDIKKIEDSPVPVDVGLPGLTHLLNRKGFKDLLREHLGSFLGPVTDCSIVYLRYKPGTNCIVACSLKCSTENLSGFSQFLIYAKILTEVDYHTALQKTLKHRWVRVGSIPPVIPLAREKAVLYVFPNDPIIDGLRLLSDPKKLQRILYEHYEEYPESGWRISDKRIRLTPVRYKPERRVVLRCDTRVADRESPKRIPLSVYLRFYGDDGGESVFRLQKRLYGISLEGGRFRIARPIAYVRHRRLLIMETLPGDPLHDSLVGGQAREAVRETAAALAALHESGENELETRDMNSYLADARATCSMLKSLLPESRDLVEDVMAGLENCRGGCEETAAGFVHGDFYYGQILSDSNGISILDFDRSHSGNPASDMGNFCAHLRLLKIRGQMENESPLAEDFIEEYQRARGKSVDSREIRFWTAYGLFLLAVGPFRHLEPDWHSRTEEILRECHRILS